MVYYDEEVIECPGCGLDMKITTKISELDEVLEYFGQCDNCKKEVGA